MHLEPMSLEDYAASLDSMATAAASGQEGGPQGGDEGRAPRPPLLAKSTRRPLRSERASDETLAAQEHAAQLNWNRGTMRALRAARVSTADTFVALIGELTERERGAMRPSVRVAADAFDTKRKARADAARHAYESQRKDGGGSARGAIDFRRAVAELSRSRYVAPQRALKLHVATSARRAVADDVRSGGVAAWRLEDSCWKDRPRNADSQSFYDDEAVFRRAFDLDWGLALRSHGLAEHIVCHDDGESDDAGSSTAADSPRSGSPGSPRPGSPQRIPNVVVDMEADEITEVGQALWRHHRLIYSIFDVYAAMPSAAGSLDITRLEKKAYTRFVNDCRMPVRGSKRCGSSAFDQIFILVNAKDESAPPKAGRATMTGSGGGGEADDQGAGEDDDTRALNRQEFMQILVRIAIVRFVLTKEEQDVSAAVERLFSQIIAPAMREVDGVAQDSNEFRRTACFTFDMSDMLKDCLSSIRAVFEVYANTLSHEANTNVNTRMSLDEWLSLLHDTDLIDAEFSVKEAMLAFVWSRQLVVDERLHANRVKLLNLGFEDFMEALIRTSTMKALPTDDELALAYLSDDSSFEHVPDAGEFMLTMRRDQPQAYKAWLSEHAVRWDDFARWDRGDGVGEKYDRALAHLLELLIRTIDGQTQGKDDMMLSRREVTLFKARAAAEKSRPGGKATPSTAAISVATAPKARPTKPTKPKSATAAGSKPQGRNKPSRRG
jgi:hypothetical protein